MNKELLNENLNLILEGLKTAIDTANAELPAILEEIVRWGIISSFTLMVMGFISLLASFSLLVLSVTRPEDNNSGWLFKFGGTSIIFLIFSMFQLKEFLFAYTSPKLYIIHYLKDLVQ